MSWHLDIQLTKNCTVYSAAEPGHSLELNLGEGCELMIVNFLKKFRASWNF